MAEVKHTAKTAESTGFKNVSQAEVDAGRPGPGEVIDTAVRQAAATVPGSEAAAEEARPSDKAVAEFLKTRPKTFRDTVREREAAVARGEEPNNEAYPTAARDVKPSKRTEAEMARGKEAQGDAAVVDPNAPAKSAAARAAHEYNRNKAAEQQVERVLGVDDAPPDLKARPSEPPNVDATESGGHVKEEQHDGTKAGAEAAAAKKK